MTRKKGIKFTPSQIKDYLDQYVIGQDQTKRVLSVAIYNHYKRCTLEDGNLAPETTVEKSNILLAGPTGTGKTYMIQTIARLLDIPCYVQDCTKLTESGYSGADVENCLAGLLRSSGFSLTKAERGIIILDEVDKCAKHDKGSSLNRDVSGEGVQQGLLKIVEGDLVDIPPNGGRRHPEETVVRINTKNILFIAMGAFVGLEQLTTDGLCQFGMIPEFIGRFPVLTNTRQLTESELVRILTEPRNSLIKQYQELLRLDNTELIVPEETLQAIAHQAMELHTGARGLRSIMESLMLDIMYDAPQNLKKRKPVPVELRLPTALRPNV